MSTRKNPGVVAAKSNAPKESGSKANASKTVASKISPARQVAFHLLRELSASVQAHSDDLLQGPKVEALSPQDRNLCTALVMGVLRWQMGLDAEIATLLDHKSKMDEPVRIALRLGVFQLLLLDRIPAHAAISDSVELTKRAGHRFASGLVNAILRKVSRQAEDMRASLRSEAAHPAWLVERWRRNFGAQKARAICDYDQKQPQVVLRIGSDDVAGHLNAEGVLLGPGAFLTVARQVLSGSVNTEEPACRLQDEGSQLVAELLGNASAEVTSILDCCAAPGGKTAILAEHYPTAHVTAWDVSANRLAKMRERFKSAASMQHVEYEEADAALQPADRQYDLVLADVPCSGTGTLSRNPEIKLRLQAEELQRQHERQVAILTAALRYLAPGGRLLYSTCSLEPEESEQVVERVLADAVGVRVVSIADRLRELLAGGVLHEQGAQHLLDHAVQGSFLRTIPGISPCDGFFAALLKRE